VFLVLLSYIIRFYVKMSCERFRVFGAFAGPVLSSLGIKGYGIIPELSTIKDSLWIRKRQPVDSAIPYSVRGYGLKSGVIHKKRAL